MNEGSSYRTILRSSSIMGGASIINIVAGLVKMKAAAILLGPAGVGMIGLYQSLVQTAATVAGLGLGNVGTRQVAEANAAGDPGRVATVRRALLWGTITLALLGGLTVFFLSAWIARHILEEPERQNDVTWLALGVALSVAAGSQAALLQGLHRIGDLAQVSVGSSIISSALGVTALQLWGPDGLLALVLVAPLVTFALGHLFVSRLRQPQGPPSTLRSLSAQWRIMAGLGFAFMISAFINTGSHLAVRSMVHQEIGTEGLGQFQAAWTVGMTYLAFVLGAMGNDYYPRLSAVIHDPAAACRLVNEQTEVALLLCAPMLLATLGLAPWIIQFLYSDDFGVATEILRWHLLGDVLKVMSWPLGFVLLACNAGKTFLTLETFAMTVYVTAVWLALPWIGVTATGAAFLALYVVYLPLVWWFGSGQIGLQWSSAVKTQAAATIASAILVQVTVHWSDAFGACTGLVLASCLGLRAFTVLSNRKALRMPVGPQATIRTRLQRWLTRTQ